MKETFEQRLFRVCEEAGYSPVRILTLTPEEMVMIPNITVPDIRAILCAQNKILADSGSVRASHLRDVIMKGAKGHGR